MKKTVFTFGLFSGLVSAGMMVISLPFLSNGSLDFKTGEILGYTTIVLSFIMVYFGMRSYRDNQLGGTISYGKAFQVGILITLVSCLLYVIVWEIIYFGFQPDFGANYSAYMIAEAKKSGASPQEIARQIEEGKKMMEMYNNPFINAAITFMEPFPIGAIMTAISAFFVRTRPKAVVS
ncbi:MAG TPA: DUF4199 domain-containing protein [Flavobacteriales bacterium]|nr:DUF4199 domain-containing protein [Flavobacteriales bacterium]